MALAALALAVRGGGWAAAAEGNGSVGAAGEAAGGEGGGGEERLALPEKASGGAGEAWDWRNEKLKLDRLGPIILNPDCTMRRIANWDALSPQERAVAWRRIAKRNGARRAECERLEAAGRLPTAEALTAAEEAKKREVREEEL